MCILDDLSHASASARRAIRVWGGVPLRDVGASTVAPATSSPQKGSARRSTLAPSRPRRGRDSGNASTMPPRGVDLRISRPRRATTPTSTPTRRRRPLTASYGAFSRGSLGVRTPCRGMSLSATSTSMPRVKRPRECFLLWHRGAACGGGGGVPPAPAGTCTTQDEKSLDCPSSMHVLPAPPDLHVISRDCFSLGSHRSRWSTVTHAGRGRPR